MSISDVFVFSIPDYNSSEIYKVLPEAVFSLIVPGNRIVLKPNWIRESHISRPNEWEQVITHPTVITAVLQKVLEKLQGQGNISIIDGPETTSSFEKILSHYPVTEWKTMASNVGIPLEIIDLRDDEWVNKGDVIVERKKLPGDPRGSTQINLLSDASEFFSHSHRNGYYGADSNITETNQAHDGLTNLYRVSRTVLEADVFINIPKLKTHKKSGITASLKNLVGINTYKNFLPHNSIGTFADGGDQFSIKNTKSIIESHLMPFIHQNILISTRLSKIFGPVMSFGKKIFGDNSKTIRGGSWYGNDTLWRTILDLNKIVFYANPDGTLREEQWHLTKKYITVVDGIVGGEGNGPKAPDPKNLGFLFCGTNPVATDAVSAYFMGFNPLKIPSIANAFPVKRYSIVNFKYEDIIAKISNENYKLEEIPQKYSKNFQPHHGWVGHIELS